MEGFKARYARTVVSGSVDSCCTTVGDKLAVHARARRSERDKVVTSSIHITVTAIDGDRTWKRSKVRATGQKKKKPYFKKREQVRMWHTACGF